MQAEFDQTQETLTNYLHDTKRLNSSLSSQLAAFYLGGAPGVNTQPRAISRTPLSREPQDFLAGLRRPRPSPVFDNKRKVTLTSPYTENKQRSAGKSWHQTHRAVTEGGASVCEAGRRMSCGVCVYIHLNEPSLHECSAEQMSSLTVSCSGPTRELQHAQYTASHFRCTQMQILPHNEC